MGLKRYARRFHQIALRAMLRPRAMQIRSRERARKYQASIRFVSPCFALLRRTSTTCSAHELYMRGVNTGQEDLLEPCKVTTVACVSKAMNLDRTLCWGAVDGTATDPCGQTGGCATNDILHVRRGVVLSTFISDCHHHHSDPVPCSSNIEPIGTIMTNSVDSIECTGAHQC